LYAKRAARSRAQAGLTESDCMSLLGYNRRHNRGAN
jgi:hypothetical protein